MKKFEIKNADKKARLKQFKKKEQQDKLDDMPISLAEFQQLLDYLYDTEYCDHTLKQTEAYFSKNKDRQKILDWLHRYGGICDCGVAMNVESEYLFVLEEWIDERFKEEIQEEKNNRFHLFKDLNFKNATIDSFNSSFGVSISKLEKPWRFYIPTDSEEIIKGMFCFGKKKPWPLRCAPHVLLYVEDKLSIPEHLPKMHMPMTLEQEEFELMNTKLEGMIGSSKDFMPCYIWLYDKKNPRWYFFFITDIARKKEDLRQLVLLLKNISQHNTR